MRVSDVATVVVLDGTPLGYRSPVDIEVVDGRIARIVETGLLDATAPGSREVVDAHGCLVLPGLVDAHCHLDKTLFGRPWVPHGADDTLQSRISNDRRRRTELGLPDPREGSFRTDMPLAWQVTTIQGVLHAASSAVHRGTISPSKAPARVGGTVIAALPPAGTRCRICE